MTVALFIVGTCIVLLATGHLDETLARRYPSYQRAFAWIFGETPEPETPEPRTHVRVHCPFCGATPPLHDIGCGRLDRLDATETSR